MFKKSLSSLIFVVALGGGIIHILNSALGLIIPLQMRPFHLGISIVLVVLVDILKKLDGGIFTLRNIVNLLFLILGVIGTAYFAINFEQIARSVGRISPEHVIFGTMTILAILVITWNIVGRTLAIIAIIFILYAMVGHIIPGALGHRGFSFTRTIYFVYSNSSSIFGVPIDTSARIIVLFMIMGEFVERSGAGKFFMAFSDLVAKRTRGGAAKAGVISSALFGTTTGTPIANVMVTGSITIPMMQRSGINNTVAAAITAAAGSGGVIVPPIMGAGAFMMADTLGIPYMQVALAAAIPALLYYLSLFFAVDFYTAKNQIKQLSGSSDDSELYRQLRVYAHTIIPLAVLIYCVVIGFSIFRAAIISIAVTPLVAAIRKETRMNVKDIASAIADGMKNTAIMGLITGCAGIIVGVIALTGFGFSFSIFLNYFRDFQFMALIVGMVMAIVLGLGMPAVAAYLVTATIVAPPLINMGFMPIAAHMFIFYFSVFASITPPVALASITAAGIARADPWETSLVAMKFAIVAFLSPFLFIYYPSLLAQGTFLEMLILMPSTLIGIYLFAGAIQGYLFGSMNHWFLRILLFCSSILLIIPTVFTGSIGAIVVVMVYFANKKIERAI